MRRLVILPVIFISMAFLSGCNQIGFPQQQEEKPLTLVTPSGYQKPVPIASAEMSWEKKAVLAMIAPSIAEQIENTHSALKAPANQKPGAVAQNKAVAPPVKVAKASPGHKNGRRVASAKHKKASKAIAARRSHHAVVAAKF